MRSNARLNVDPSPRSSSSAVPSGKLVIENWRAPIEPAVEKKSSRQSHAYGPAAPLAEPTRLLGG